MNRPIAYAVEHFGKETKCEVLCNLPPCKPDVTSSHYMAVPLTVAEVEELADATGDPVNCEGCGRRLA